MRGQASISGVSEARQFEHALHERGRHYLDRSLRRAGVCLFASHRHPLDHQPGDLQPEVPDWRVGILLARVVHPLAVDVRDVRHREVSRNLVFPYRSLVHARGFLGARLLLDVVPNLGGGEILAAEGVAVDGGGGRFPRLAHSAGRR